MGSADPHEPPLLPALQHNLARTPHVEHRPGPERTYAAAEADPTWLPRPVGFTAPPPTPCTGRHCAAHQQDTP